MSQRILVACIGNIFRGDDGFGVAAATALVAAHLPPDVTVVDYGIRGFDLASAMLGSWSAVILVDAVARGGAPGTVYLLQPAEASAEQNGIDPHSMDPVRVLETAHSLGEVSAEVFIVGCEPLDLGDEIEGRMGLSDVVWAAIPNAVKMIQGLAERLAGGVIMEYVAN
ncbi:MAG TPA: hydrogenase maturation protease [Terracidiphilus sp.]|jgi:hydrogenase maturation protease